MEESLRGAAIFDEVKDRLKKSALGLSGGQQQRLCIARALAVQPDVLLMDEPTSALDPISTLKIEELMVELKKKYTVVVVTHNMQQAARVSDDTAFFLVGEVIEFNHTDDIFARPQDKTNRRLYYRTFWLIGGKTMSVRMNFEHELETLRENMDAMGKGIQQAFADLLSAIALNDLEELDRIQKNDRKINEMERKIEAECLLLLTRQRRCWQVICVSYLLL